MRDEQGILIELRNGKVLNNVVYQGFAYYKHQAIASGEVHPTPIEAILSLANKLADFADGVKNGSRILTANASTLSESAYEESKYAMSIYTYLNFNGEGNETASKFKVD